MTTSFDTLSNDLIIHLNTYLEITDYINTLKAIHKEYLFKIDIDRIYALEKHVNSSERFSMSKCKKCNKIIVADEKWECYHCLSSFCDYCDTVAKRSICHSMYNETDESVPHCLDCFDKYKCPQSSFYYRSQHCRHT